MYAIIPQQIPQGMRAEVNEKILFAIDSGKDLIPAESIYNCYTGIGGPILPITTSTPKRRRNPRWDSSSPRMKYAGTWRICFLPPPRK